jgi:hypothetical protein
MRRPARSPRSADTCGGASQKVPSEVSEHAVDLRAEVLGHLRVRDDEQILVVVRADRLENLGRSTSGTARAVARGLRIAPSGSDEVLAKDSPFIPSASTAPATGFAAHG